MLHAISIQILIEKQKPLSVNSNYKLSDLQLFLAIEKHFGLQTNLRTIESSKKVERSGFSWDYIPLKMCAV